MKTQYFTASSLDGFIADPEDSLDWLFPLGNLSDTSYPAFIREVGALAMGSATYEWMLRHVVGPQADHPQPWPYQQPAWVFTTRTLPIVPGPDIRFARGDVRPVHQTMVDAARGKNIWIVGGGDLAGFRCRLARSRSRRGSRCCPGRSRRRSFAWFRSGRLAPGSRSSATR